MDPSIIDLTKVAELGFGIVIAVIALNWKRGDDKAYQARLIQLISVQQEAIERNTMALNNITTILTSLSETVANQQRFEEMILRIEKKLTGE